MVKSDKVISIYFLYRDFWCNSCNSRQDTFYFSSAAEDRGPSCAHQNIATGRTDIKTYFINIAAIWLLDDDFSVRSGFGCINVYIEKNRTKWKQAVVKLSVIKT